MEEKLFNAAMQLPEAKVSFHAVQVAAANASVRPHRYTRRIAIAVICFTLLLCVSFGSYGMIAEAKEYTEAIEFFDEHELPTDGLTRREIRAIYRDITTKAFVYSKTADVIEGSLSSNQVIGYEILPSEPTPEQLEALWNTLQSENAWIYYNDGIQYKYYEDYKYDSSLGFEVFDKSYIEQYNNDTLIWCVSFSEFPIYGYCTVSDGVIVYGASYRWSSTQHAFAWIAKISSNGTLMWKTQLEHEFKTESIEAVLENQDGSYAVFSRGNLEYLCLTQFSPKGEPLLFQKTNVGNYGIWNAAHLSDGYIVQLGSFASIDQTKIIKVDPNGNITDSFSYASDDAYYYITDMIEFGGKIYLSGYSVPCLPDEDENAGGRFEIAEILNYIFEKDYLGITEEALTPMVKDHYTAILLVCDPGAGTPQEFYCVKGGLGNSLSVSTSGQLLWDVDMIVSTYLSPHTSSFTIGGVCNVYRYSFSSNGELLEQVNTQKLSNYRR